MADLEHQTPAYTYGLQIVWKKEPDGNEYRSPVIGPYPTLTARKKAKKELRDAAKASGRTYKGIEEIPNIVPHRTALSWMSSGDN